MLTRWAALGKQRKRAGSDGGGGRERTSVRRLAPSEAALGSARGAGCSSLGDPRYHQPYDGPHETSQVIFNRKISELGNTPSSLE